MLGNHAIAEYPIADELWDLGAPTTAAFLQDWISIPRYALPAYAVPAYALPFGIGDVVVITFIGSIGVCVTGRHPGIAVSGVSPRSTVSARSPEVTATAEGMGCSSD